MSSSKNIPHNKQIFLWAKAAGRCEFEGCNRILYKDLLTKEPCNLGEKAHIIAESPKGPRGDKILSKKLSTSVDNLMLLCKQHHYLVDKNPKKYTKEVLMKMKLQKEKQIARMLDIHEDKATKILVYKEKIGNRDINIDYKKIKEAITTHYCDIEEDIVDITKDSEYNNDFDKNYWEEKKEKLKRNFEEYIEKIEKHKKSHLSIFAIAPQPLLIYLGSLLTKRDITIYQKKRNPSTWCDLKEKFKQKIKLKKPKNFYKNIAINISLSGQIENKYIYNIVGKQCSIWKLYLDKPNNDFIRNNKQIVDFGKKIFSLFEEIKAKHCMSKSKYINVFAAMPHSLAIEFGKNFMEKAHFPLKIYDRYDNKHFKFTFNIDRY